MNEVLEDQGVYKAPGMTKQPKAVRGLISRLEQGQVLSLSETRELNRSLIEENCPEETPPGLVSESARLLKIVTVGARTAYDQTPPDQSVKHKKRSFETRLLNLAGVGLLVVSLVFLYLGFPLVISGGVSLWGFFNLIHSYKAYWQPHLDILRMQWNRDLIFLVNKQKKDLEKQLKLNPSVISQPANGDGDSTISLARQEGSEQKRNELLADRPSVDMIVGISKNDIGKVDFEEYLRRKTWNKSEDEKDPPPDKLIRNDIPALVMTSKREGDLNAYLDVWGQINRDIKAGKYPNLRTDPRIMFVFEGTGATRNKKIHDALLDWKITNGYRAARNGSQEHKPGHILILDTDEVTFGPIPEFPDSGITMLTSRVNSHVLKSGTLVHTRITSTGQREVTDLFENVDIDSLQAIARSTGIKGKILNLIKDNFNLYNSSLDQYPYSNGIFLVGQDATEVLTKTAEYAETHHLWEKFRLSLSADFLKAIVTNILDNERRAEENSKYARKRVAMRGVVLSASQGLNVQGELEDLYSFISRQGIKVYDDLPYSRSEAFFPNAVAPSPKEAAKLEKALNHRRDVAALSARQGGVNFSGARESIQFNQNEYNSSVKSDSLRLNPITASLKSFRGFEFQVIQYQSISNPAQLFRGPSVEVENTLTLKHTALFKRARKNLPESRTITI